MRILSLILIQIVIAAAMPVPGPAMEMLPQADGRWTKIFSRSGIAVYSRETGDSDILTFRAVGVLQARIEQVMEVLRKVEISREWMPDVAERHTLKDYSDLHAITYSINPLPWPFADREMVLRNRLHLDRENKFLVLDTHSVDQSGAPRKTGVVRARLHSGRTLFRPVGPEQTAIDLNVLVDPGGRIPVWLTNLTQKNMPYDFLRALEKKAARTDYPLRPAFQAMLNDLLALLKS
jgi:START domain